MSGTLDQRFRFFAAPDGPPKTLLVAPQLASWDAGGSDSQVRLRGFLDHLSERARASGSAAGPLAFRMDVGLPAGVDWLGAYDLDNYLFPVAQELGAQRYASFWATKRPGGASAMRIETARQATAPAAEAWQVAVVRPTGSASSQAWKESVFLQVAGVNVRAAEGPLEMLVAFRTGGGRVWSNLWKQSLDALGPVLGIDNPSKPFHPRDGRIVSLGLHHAIDASLGHDVEIAYCWRSAPGYEHLARAQAPGTVTWPRDPAVSSTSAVRHPAHASPRSSTESPSAGSAAGGHVVFDHDDPGYLAWIAAHPGGFVVNAQRRPKPGYLKLHRAGCSFVSMLQPGYQRWTSGEYIKICAPTRAPLDHWARTVVGGSLQDQCTCRP